ncbi:DNA damage-binding protein 2 isoform X1 [Neopelma chrysocephalum]|uniref:DNA damage-binding protein 2 isoform X1 n=1 Tax=Neopelma chrysocephalum TaxID=114329 RepID=UPI000FCD03C9|nr:DNA damage-binding protein 2 isoform X1 [Neopelma chrysocephalum]XP_027561055.1 DNA damage-binding protein 2 isoform X1 [Neopelma chrysocephalum]XP_027561063.1 DNA damage-binding protein 2 isoform X1 [Neopelma chrysocephalum]XP_027561073.1 DNA damage-binding protein 2 isoform X1 [Neopelma chrysocephalum]XP_027561082.1 DNA damage-binding protein 2 isoform X1 [Neopelma chrysocephalum]XP_027561089.1 DNA damage-binding protein 2 isoform X1 [Neopelma chrysocephalum]XP_027561107.1 DNA damage-bin
MAPVNQPKDKECESVYQHWPEEAKSAGKRKADYEKLGNETQTKRLFVRKTSKPPGKIGWSGGGSVVRNNRVLSHQLEQQRSIVHYVYQNMLGGSIRAPLRQCLQLPFLRSLASYRLFRTASPFDRRVTCLEWHPTHPSTVAVGSKGGDIILWDYEVLTKTCFIKGKGAGDFLGDIKFSPYEAVKLYVASGDGTLSLQDLESRAVQVISRAPDCGHEHHNVCCWYCSVDVSASCRAVVTGDNVGNVVLLSTSGEEIWKLKLHRKKVTHVEFNSRCEWLLATASVDQTVKIWDLRNIKNKMSFLHVLPHEKPVNAAYFSPTDGAKLLSTDQRNEIRVYSSSDWTKPQHLIPHPHRHFQHLTPIKATWHPRYDLIVVGRYPDPKFPEYTMDELRTVDVFDGNTGEMVCQLHDPNACGIISLNKFNPMGDTLASGTGFNILIWSREEMVAKKQEHLLKAMTEQGIGSWNSSRRGGQRQANPGTSKLKAKLLSWELDEMRTKNNDSKSKGRKRKGKDLDK